jgi:hypothetical protein
MGLLADLIHEAESVACVRMALGLQAIGSLTQVGRAAQPSSMRWSEVRVGEGCGVDDEYACGDDTSRQIAASGDQGK